MKYFAHSKVDSSLIKEYASFYNTLSDLVRMNIEFRFIEKRIEAIPIILLNATKFMISFWEFQNPIPYLGKYVLFYTQVKKLQMVV